MNIVHIKIIETAVVVISYLIIKTIVFKIIKKTLFKKLMYQSRGRIIRNGVNLILTLLLIIFILIIWGVNQSRLAVFFGSVMTVVGVAFFAQWSLLSNITSCIIIFFNHPVKLDDSIVILEGKDYEIEGKVRKIGLFFVTLETIESGEITLPNNVFILKSIKNLSDGNRSHLKEEDAD